MVFQTSIAFILVLILALIPSVVQAQVNDRGLFIAPLRQSMILQAGSEARGEFIIGNYTDEVMDVSIDIKRFSVEDYSYSYEFEDPGNDWLKLEVGETKLEPKQRKTIPFNVRVPRDAAPGGHYYTMIASTAVSKVNSFPVTLQAATLLYLTVDGEVVKKSGIEGVKVPSVVIGSGIPVQFDVRNTGNVHFMADFFARLSSGGAIEEELLVMPDTVRRLDGSLGSPLWPGIYDIAYGYAPDYQKSAIEQRAKVVYLPYWTLMLSAALLLAGIFFTSRNFRRRLPKKQSSDSNKKA